MRPFSQVAVLPADWPKVLEKIQHALTQALAEVENREHALGQAARGPMEPTPPPNAWQDFQTCCRLAERQAADLDAALQVGEQSLQEWLAAAETLRNRLANSELRT
jgi:hypothetical protein